MRGVVILFALGTLAVGCNDSHARTPREAHVCGTVGSPRLMQTTESGECVSVTIGEGTVVSSDTFEVTGVYPIGWFEIMRAPCEPGYLPWDATASRGYAMGMATSSVVGDLVHIQLHATVEFGERDPHPAVTRNVDIDTTFRWDDVPFCRHR